MTEGTSRAERCTIVFADDSETMRVVAMMALEAEPIDLLLVADGAVVERTRERARARRGPAARGCGS
jgi:hypothetical protein